MHQKFETYYNYLLAENAKHNLTAITEREEVFVKHFEDSLAGAEMIPHGSTVLDIGAGAGFPSVPLKIIRDDIRVTMLDSVGKKVDFLNRLIKLLELDGITAVHSRAEDFDKKMHYDIVLARAVARLNTLAEYALPFLKIGGQFIAYKASDIDDEITAAQNALEILGGQITLKKQITLNNGLENSDFEKKTHGQTLSTNAAHRTGEKIPRTLVVITKIAPTPPKYPRKGNKPRLYPLQ